MQPFPQLFALVAVVVVVVVVVGGGGVAAGALGLGCRI